MSENRETGARAPPGDTPPPLDGLFADAYERLRRLAGVERGRWRGNETLNTTALVHEVYLKLADQAAGLRNPDRLLAVASRAMRHVLVNYAEGQQAGKRGGGLTRVTLGVGAGAAAVPSTWEELLALDEALERLATLNARQRDVVECRFFGGLSVEETSAALEVSTATVKRDWRSARIWLHQELDPHPPDGSPGQ